MWFNIAKAGNLLISIGADYSATQVWLAVLDDKKVVHAFGSADVGLEESEYEFFWQSLKAVLASISSNFECQWLYLERPFVNNQHRSYSGLQMMRMCTYIETAAYACDITTTLVNPQSWRKVVFGNGRPDDRKELARFHVAHEFGYETTLKKDHNICEAICIAEYGNKTRSEND